MFFGLYVYVSLLMWLCTKQMYTLWYIHTTDMIRCFCESSIQKKKSGFKNTTIFFFIFSEEEGSIDILKLEIGNWNSSCFVAPTWYRGPVHLGTGKNQFIIKSRDPHFQYILSNIYIIWGSYIVYRILYTGYLFYLLFVELRNVNLNS